MVEPRVYGNDDIDAPEGQSLEPFRKVCCGCFCCFDGLFGWVVVLLAQWG
jgi:hypothetical protein